MTNATVNLDGGTISSPGLYQNLFIVSKVIRRHISKEDGYLKNDKDTELEYLFDLDNFIQKELKTCFGSVGIGPGPCIYVQRRKRSSAPVPTVDQIYKFLSRIFKKLSLKVECAIVALLYAERLMSQGKIAMNGRNWRPILLASILMASKMWDDLSSWNIEFSALFPIFTLKEINMLEKLFLQEINYNLFISGSEYARYYFALRGLRYTNDHKIPRNWLTFQVGGRLLQERSKVAQAMMERKSKSSISRGDYGTHTPSRSTHIPVLTNSRAESTRFNGHDLAESLREESIRASRSNKIKIPFHTPEAASLAETSTPSVKVIQVKPNLPPSALVKADSNEFVLSLSPSPQSGSDDELSRTSQLEELPNSVDNKSISNLGNTSSLHKEKIDISARGEPLI